MDKWIWANGRGLTQFTALAAQMSLLGNLLGSGTQKRADATADLTGAIEVCQSCLLYLYLTTGSA